VHGK
jgi:hypothetical protein